ncbi:von Willebrand factor A domain-containing protein 8, partial [Irineochytrium annulatum]
MSEAAYGEGSGHPAATATPHSMDAANGGDVNGVGDSGGGAGNGYTAQVRVILTARRPDDEGAMHQIIADVLWRAPCVNMYCQSASPPPNGKDQEGGHANGNANGNYSGGKMDFREVDDKSLRRYRKVLKLKSTKSPLSRDELVNAVTKHFNSQEINEKEAIAAFIYSIRHQEVLTELTASAYRARVHSVAVVAVMDRIKQLHGILSALEDADPNTPWAIQLNETAGASSTGKHPGATLTIGDVTVAVAKAAHADLVPWAPKPFYEGSQEMLRHLRWIMQKDAMNQDIFLLGPPGALKRHLVYRYAALMNREVEYVSLSKDVTDSDLKQRREIRDGTAFYTDGACVRAAVEGRLLVLDGIEKAERNVLPILNNLLENREMSLEDGRFLVSPKRWDGLMEGGRAESEMKKWKLVKTSPKFTVIVLGLPVPKYDGHPLDPPFRSRFQARNIPVPTYLSQVTHLASLTKDLPQRLLERLVSVGILLRDSSADASSASSVSMPEFPTSLDRAVCLLNAIPDGEARAVLDMLYPFTLMSTLDDEQRSVVEAAYQRFGFVGPEIRVAGTSAAYRQAGTGYRIRDVVVPAGAARGRRMQLIREDGSEGVREVALQSGPDPVADAEFFVKTEYHEMLLTNLMLCHSVGDLCIIGEKGCGKSALLRCMTKLLGYQVELIPLYKDMSARDLLQRRSTNQKGDTIWEHSALVKAAIEGSLAILDQIEVLGFGTLGSIAALIEEREIGLPDGSRLMKWDHWDDLKAKGIDMAKERCLRVHPGFRIVAIARPTTMGGDLKGSWLSSEILNLFLFVPMRALSYTEEMDVIGTLCPGIEESALKILLKCANMLRTKSDETLRALAAALSTRQLIRIARRVALFKGDELFELIFKAALGRFLPTLAKQMLEGALEESGIVRSKKEEKVVTYEIVKDAEGNDALRIGDVSCPVSKDSNPLLVPDIVFYDNARQLLVLEEMLKDYVLGEHLLLIGNQGVGKNKLTDRFLQLLKLPREYIQLHRDTTVHSLTSTPTIVDGILRFEDSPLVRAVIEGSILVVDEADKAPTHVTSVLKSLVEDGEMVLSDGRRIVTRGVEGQQGVIVVHKNFRMFVLANRPGFPFLGNDFYREIGDVFATHCVENPDQASELSLLRNYAPDLAEDVLLRLTSAFHDLRRLVDEGLINYPYSTRELVSVVRHLQAYPGEGLSRALGNVFDFDLYEGDVRDMVIEILNKHGIPTGMESDFRVDLGQEVPLPSAVPIERWNRGQGRAEAVMCATERKKINLRGGWNLTMPAFSIQLDRVEGRSLVFSELLYSIKLPTKGEGLDVIASTAHEGRLYALTTNPVTLSILDERHRRASQVDLYEYYPLQRVAPQLRMAEMGLDKIALHNPADHTVLRLDFAAKTVKSIMLGEFDFKIPSIFSSGLAEHGLLVFYQVGCPRIVVLDFETLDQINVELPIRGYDSVFDQRSTYILTKAAPGDKVPTVFEKLEVVPVGNTKNVEVHSISTHRLDLYDYPRSTRPAVLRRFQNSYGAYMSGLPETLTNGIIPGCEVMSWPRDKADSSAENGYHNLENGVIHLRQTQQLATVVPGNTGKNDALLEILGPDKGVVRRIKMPVAIPGSAVLR